jgi:membrane-anchored protein YejM (alkaline phosphatase superfamily)
MKQNVGLTENPRKYNFILVIVDGGRLDRLRLKKNFTDLSKKATFFTKMITYGAQTVMSMHATFTGLYGNINGANNYFGSALFKKDKCKIPVFTHEAIQ